MGRIRTIKPEFPQSESMGRVSRDARLLFIMLWTLVDDEGRARAAPRMLASLLYPYDDAPKTHVVEWLFELEREGAIRLYEVDGNAYLQIEKWLTHQKIDKPSKSRLPAPPEKVIEDSSSPREASATDLVPSILEGTKDHMPDKSGAADAAPARKRASKPPEVEPEGFADFYQTYPRHEDRIDAAKAYRDAIKKTTADVILQGARRYASEKRGVEKEFIKLPAGWLRNQRWNDGDDGKPRVKPGFHSAEEAEAQRLMKERMHGQTTQ